MAQLEHGGGRPAEAAAVIVRERKLHPAVPNTASRLILKEGPYYRKEGSWGYRLLVVDDLDGNQLFFNYPNEAASSQVASEEAQSPPRNGATMAR